MIRRLIVLTCIALAVGSACADGRREGKLSDNIFWELEDSVLTVSGRGKMPSWTTTSLVRNPFQDERFALGVKEIIIDEGITEVGNFTFGSRGNVRGDRVRREGGKAAFEPSQSEETADGSALYSNLVHISLPSSLRTIGAFAFARVPVRGITLPEGLRKIGASAFANSGLRFVRLPSTVKSVGAEAFASCAAMSAADLSNLDIELSPGMFFNCESLRMILHTPNVRDIRHGALDATPFADFTDAALIDMFRSDGLDSYLNQHLPARAVFKGTDEEYQALRERTLRAFSKTEARNAAMVYRLDEKFILPFDEATGTCEIRTLGHGNLTLSLTADQARALRADWAEIAAASTPRFDFRDGLPVLRSATFTLPDGTALDAYCNQPFSE